MATEDETPVNAEMPKNFSCVIDNHLCACGLPAKPEHLRFLRNQGVTIIVSLTSEYELPENAAKDFKVISIKMADFSPPTLDQVVQFVNVMEQAERNNECVAVHCAAGKGRTGTLISSYLVKRFRLTAVQAIRLLRRLRPGAVETKAQEDMVSTYHTYLNPLRPQPVDTGHSMAPGTAGQHEYEALVSGVAPQGRHDLLSQATQLKQLAAGLNSEDPCTEQISTSNPLGSTSSS